MYMETELIDLSVFQSELIATDIDTAQVSMAQHTVAAALVNQLFTVGFVHIIGHGVDVEHIENVFKYANEFFLQPIEVKNGAISKDKARRGNN